MSGVFGIIAPDGPVDFARHLARMGQVMAHREWNVVESFVAPDDGVGLGRIGIGIFNRQSQPVWNTSRTMALVMAGEFYGTEQLRRECGGDPTDEALALHLYEQRGARFASEIDGAFVIAIWDASRRQVVLVNDRFGLYPTFVGRIGRGVVFAPEVRGVLQHPGIGRALREESVAEYLRFQRLLGQKTFCAGVDLIPGASVMTWDAASGALDTHQYWRWQDVVEARPSLRFDEAVETGAALLRKAIATRCRPDERMGVYLSGGLDSRMLLGMAPRSRHPVHTFTFGQPACRDVHYAAQVARVAHTVHHHHAFDNGRWVQDNSELHVQLTEGFHPWTHMHGLSMLPEVRQHVDVNLSGLGDLIWSQSNFTPRALVMAPDDLAFTTLFYELYHQKYNWPGLTEADAHAIFLPSYHRRHAGTAYERFVAELEPFAGLPFGPRAFAFNVVNHYWRHLHYHVIFGRSHLEYRLPYFDVELLTFCLNLPYDIGENRRLQRAILARELPRLAAVAVDADELPVDRVPAVRVLRRAARKVRRVVTASLGSAVAGRPTLYADYESWLRTDLHSWAESLLTTGPILSRGVFRADGLRSLLNRGRANLEPSTIGKVAPIMTLEMMLRSYFD